MRLHRCLKHDHKNETSFKEDKECEKCNEKPHCKECPGCISVWEARKEVCGCPQEELTKDNYLKVLKCVEECASTARKCQDVCPKKSSVAEWMECIATCDEIKEWKENRSEGNEEVRATDCNCSFVPRQVGLGGSHFIKFQWMGGLQLDVCTRCCKVLCPSSCVRRIKCVCLFVEKKTEPDKKEKKPKPTEGQDNKKVQRIMKHLSFPQMCVVRCFLPIDRSVVLAACVVLCVHRASFLLSCDRFVDGNRPFDSSFGAIGSQNA